MKFFTNATPLDGPAATVIFRLAMERAAIPKIEFAKAVGGEWGGGSLDGAEADLEIDGEALAVTIHNAFRVKSLRGGILNKPGSLRLQDGSCITAELAHLVSRSEGLNLEKRTGTSTAKLEFDVWRWSSETKPCAWVGVLKNGYVERGNIACIGDKAERNIGLRLHGRCSWTLIETKALEGSVVVVIEAGGELDRNALWADFTALEFVLGTPLGLDLLTGVDEDLRPVAAFSPSLAIRRLDISPKDGPVPAGKHPDEDAHWIVPLFERLSARLYEDEHQVLVGVSGYVDALLEHIDANYLKAQVALEAVAKKVLDDADVGGSIGRLTKDELAWNLWVDAQSKTVADHAVDPQAAQILMNVLRSAQKRPTSRTVATALNALGIVADAEALKETKGRGAAAHTYSMGRDWHLDVEQAARRVRMVRVLLAAIVSRRVGYGGPLFGWDRETYGYRNVVRWWEDDDEQRAAGERRFEISRTADR